MNAVPTLQVMGKLLVVSFLFCVLTGSVCAYSNTIDTTVNPGVYLNFNEGSSATAFDLSGHGSSGTIHGAERVDNEGCGRAMFFNGIGDYISIPYSSLNHPEQEITVSTWFYTDSFDPQALVSSYNNGGYRLGFGDGDDLWWTINLQGPGEISVPIQHESITPHQWHYVAGTYNGKTSKIYLDGVLRNQVNASGPIHYEYNNYVLLGAEAGTYDQPSLVCPHFLRGGLDEVRIYPVAQTTGEIIDDRLRCTPGDIITPVGKPILTNAAAACVYHSGSIHLGTGESVFRTLTFNGTDETGTWNVTIPPGSALEVQVRDLYSSSYPDAWYIEMADEKGRIDRSVAFASTNSRPVGGVIPSGNATVRVKYFDGKDRFPSTVDIRFDSRTPPPPSIAAISPANILANPIIVIYSASWATLIAILLVIIWLHRRSKQQK
ncbi:LamG domain-containing protein [uncultured Methanoregula sp.]|uniref:LamG domain-containing protein n=1 Tax=uncultured Methanoregula sp. TaxID=1005933 RepID=UPI002AAABF6F|nr:LamG domain-containing protein [uncultured Methanoregula sp.]